MGVKKENTDEKGKIKVDKSKMPSENWWEV